MLSLPGLVGGSGAVAYAIASPLVNRPIQLSTQPEQIGAQRLEALAHPTQLRQVSLVDLMETLGIQPMICG